MYSCAIYVTVRCAFLFVNSLLGVQEYIHQTNPNLLLVSRVQELEAYMLLQVMICYLLNCLLVVIGHFPGAVFMFGRFLTAIQWGIIADKYGRKPVMILGISSVSVPLSFVPYLSQQLATGFIHHVMLQNWRESYISTFLNFKWLRSVVLGIYNPTFNFHQNKLINMLSRNRVCSY